MPPRFIQRLERQSQAYRDMFGGERMFDPAPYSAFSCSSSVSSGPQESPPPYQYMETPPRASSPGDQVLPPNSLILVTGASGYQGIHVVDQLLARGFRVRGTVRNADTAIWTSNYFREMYGAGRFTTAIIPDMAAQDAFLIAIKGCSGVVHCAAVTEFSPDPTKVITPTIAGAINALTAAERETQVKRFVLCSSTAAAASFDDSFRSDVTSDSWNMSAFLTAWQPPPYEYERLWAVLASSKLQTEQAVWRWYSDHKPSFTLNAVLPGVLWGKVLDPEHQGFPTTVGMLKTIWDGNATACSWSPPQHFVDVQDSALLHVAALLLPDIRNRRIFAAHTPFNLNSVLLMLRNMYPQKAFPGDVDHGSDMTILKEAGLAEDLLHRMGKKGWTDIETSVRRTCETF